MKIVKYILSIFLVIGSIGIMIDGQIAPALFLFVLGLIIFPKVNDLLKSKYQKFKVKSIRYIIYIGLFLVSSVFMNKEGFDSINIEKEIDVVKVQKKNVPVEVKESESEKMKRIMGNDGFWKLYDSELKVRIYKLILAKDCNGLQQQFNIADKNSKSNLKRTGNNNAYLMDFINTKMSKIDCY